MTSENTTDKRQDSLVIVGAGRVGRSLTAAAEAAGLAVRTAGRDDATAACSGAEVALICVPDGEISAAADAMAAAKPPPASVGHVSGAGSLELLAPARAAGSATFSMHPLQSFPDGGTPITGTPCAVAGSDASALATATDLAERLGMRPFGVAEEDRAAYHAAAAMASNLLVALEESASELMAKAGVGGARELLSPLVLRTAANWSERGGDALTGPVARGDRETVTAHREVIAERAPELLATYDVLSERARAVAARGEPETASETEEARR